MTPLPEFSPPYFQGGSGWKIYEDINCYDNYGAINVQTKMDLSLDDCKSKCLNIQGCEGIVFRPPTWCSLRKDIQIGECLHETPWNVYIFTTITTTKRTSNSTTTTTSTITTTASSSSATKTTTTSRGIVCDLNVTRYDGN